MKYLIWWGGSLLGMCIMILLRNIISEVKEPTGDKILRIIIITAIWLIVTTAFGLVMDGFSRLGTKKLGQEKKT